jgi:hypothetical protein
MNDIQTGSDLEAIASQYIEAVGQKKLDTLPTFLHAELDFGGNIAAAHGADAWAAALQSLCPILLRNDIKRVFVDGNEVCVIYDFVTTVCPVPSVEWLVFDGDKIKSIYLLFDRSRWPEVLQALQKKQNK